jgi:crotonobetainyl-CoA:carnitine CoA-transferase CaiB-like acyl-CoA transferase
MDGPFAGLKVVEFGRFIAAPYCGQLLADGGADVVKVEAIDGDDTRRNGPILPTEGRQYINKNRGKRSVAVDLGDAEARAAIQHLAATADIVVANFRPGQALKLGLDYETLSAQNPGLIYAENTAYGRQGPMANAAGMDIVLSAYSGLINVAESGPEPLGEPIIDYAAGLLLAWGVSTALYHRERTGRGQRLDVALLQAALVLLNNHVGHIDVADSWREEFVAYLKTAFAEGTSWAEVVQHRQQLQPTALLRVYYGFLRTGDGVMAVAAIARPLRLKMMEIVGFDDRWTREPGWLPDDASAYVRDLAATVEEILKEHPTGYWVAKLAAAGVPAGPMRFLEEMADDEQCWANAFLVRMEHDLLGGLTVVAPPVKFSDTPLRVTTASPTLGKHTREVLADAGLDTAAIEGLIRRGVVFGGE